MRIRNKLNVKQVAALTKVASIPTVAALFDPGI